MKLKRSICFLCFVVFTLCPSIRLVAGETLPGREYLDIVRSYADYMIEHGRDRSGDEHSPLFAAALNRIPPRTSSFFSIEGIRECNRTTDAANPMHDQNLHQILYALTKIIGFENYSRESDRVYLSLGHDFSPQGIGFVQGAHIDTLNTLTSGPWTHTKPWVTGYGKAPDARNANLCYLRYQRLPEGKSRRGHRTLILGSAFRYLDR